MLENSYLSNFDFRTNFLINFDINDLEIQITDFILFGVVPRIESPLLNLKLRKSYLNYNTKYYSIGSLVYSSFPVISLG